ncbi:hypothetical protein DFJ73DRAFT_863320 [Zopfochytrium polystomum]|nr:hypothetical protein DFJ73DRAFT_863320 [Zopfochytrium polystomum]
MIPLLVSPLPFLFFFLLLIASAALATPAHGASPAPVCSSFFVFVVVGVWHRRRVSADHCFVPFLSVFPCCCSCFFFQSPIL